VLKIRLKSTQKVKSERRASLGSLSGKIILILCFPIKKLLATN
jgi:hypothetical protein